jgi:hypothetical protein
MAIDMINLSNVFPIRLILFFSCIEGCRHYGSCMVSSQQWCLRGANIALSSIDKADAAFKQGEMNLVKNHLNTAQNQLNALQNKLGGGRASNPLFLNIHALDACVAQVWR